MTTRLMQPEMMPWLFCVPVVVVLWLGYFLYKYRARRLSAVQPHGVMAELDLPARDEPD